MVSSLETRHGVKEIFFLEAISCRLLQVVLTEGNGSFSCAAEICRATEVAVSETTTVDDIQNGLTKQLIRKQWRFLNEVKLSPHIFYFALRLPFSCCDHCIPGV